MLRKTPLLGALAVVLHDDRVLLVQRGKAPDAGLWGFPGGHVEWGETALSAAARELREETGVLATPRRYLGNLDVMRQSADGAVAHHYFLSAVACDFVSGTPVAADDAHDAAWVPFADVETGRLEMSTHVPDLLALARGHQTPDRRITALPGCVR